MVVVVVVVTFVKEVGGGGGGVCVTHTHTCMHAYTYIIISLLTLAWSPAAVYVLTRSFTVVSSHSAPASRICSSTCSLSGRGFGGWRCDEMRYA